MGRLGDIAPWTPAGPSPANNLRSLRFCRCHPGHRPTPLRRTMSRSAPSLPAEPASAPARPKGAPTNHSQAACHAPTCPAQNGDEPMRGRTLGRSGEDVVSFCAEQRGHLAAPETRTSARVSARGNQPVITALQQYEHQNDRMRERTATARLQIQSRARSWCPLPDSNRHARRRGILSPLWLPVSSRGPSNPCSGTRQRRQAKRSHYR